MRNIKYYTLLLLGLICFPALSQKAVSSAGGDAFGAGGNASFTVGQIDYVENTSNDGSVSQGVQQVYEISDQDNSNVENIENIEVSIYPNPAQEKLILEFQDLSDEYRFELVDSKGSLIQSDNVEGLKTIINTQNLSVANYYLNIYNQESLFKSFKINKIQ